MNRWVVFFFIISKRYQKGRICQISYAFNKSLVITTKMKYDEHRPKVPPALAGNDFYIYILILFPGFSYVRQLWNVSCYSWQLHQSWHGWKETSVWKLDKHHPVCLQKYDDWTKPWKSNFRTAVSIDYREIKLQWVYNRGENFEIAIQ